jgi:hypothetical protein
VHDGAVKIQVDCRRSGDPRAFILGERHLHVMRVLERAADGREFVLRQDLEAGNWRLARVHARRS